MLILYFIRMLKGISSLSLFAATSAVLRDNYFVLIGKFYVHFIPSGIGIAILIILLNNR